MSEWISCEFGSLYAEPSRNGLTKPKRVRGHGVKFVNMGEIFQYDRLKNVECDRVPLSENEKFALLKNDDLLFARQSLVLAGAGKCSIFLGDFEEVAFESHIIRVRLDQTKANPLFYYYLFRSPQGRALIEAIVEQGAGASGVRSSDLQSLMIPYTSLPQQKAIARILASLDDKIELNRRMNETLEAMARAIFKDWFVDFGPTRAKQEGRSAYLPEHLWSLFPEAIDEETGLPIGWEEKPLPEVIDFKEGPGIRNWQYTNSEEGTRFINIRCIQDNDLNIQTANRITNDEANGKYSHFHLKEWDIVVSTSGTLGRSAIVRKEHLPLVLNTSVIRFRPIDWKTTKSFLFSYLNSPYFLEELMAMASGSVQKNFGPMHLKKMRVLTPPFDLVCQFENRAGGFLNKVICNRSESDVLAELRDRLLPKLMSGEIRVPEAEKAIEEVL